MSVLALFHPLVRRWFEGRFGAPTDAQARAWPAIARGEHVLVSAPTGSGKTLTAFLWAIDSLVTGRLAVGAVRVLYLSPLKALNRDVRENLLGPLEELRALFEQEGARFPRIRVMTRSGDTPDDERRAMLRHPPEILITTPESLNLILTGSQSRHVVGEVRTVILDEIHALAGSKRGTYMMSAVERVAFRAGELQRIALSATVRPADKVAAWMAGYHVTDPGPDARFSPRPVTVVHARDARPIALSLRTPDVDIVKGPDAADLWWQAVAADLKAIVAKHRSTLIFANSRRTVEKVARLLNAGESEPIAYAHHGSLAREIRLDVEERMKQGRLRAVVATGSLELGIDIGSVEEVVLIGTPGSVAQSMQRIGRADHRVGGTSRASLFVMHGLDGVEAASMAHMIGHGDIEDVHPIANPLDVLAQVLLSMGCAATWDVDQLYAHVRAIAAFHTLPRKHFDLVLAMLAGRYAEAPIRELRPRALVDRSKNTFSARKGAEMLLYRSGGTIPDRGYYHLRLADSKAVIGELDEEFVWERRLGDQFSLGTQAWRILNVTHNDVEVGPADASGPMIPFWKAEEQNRSTKASFALLDFLDQCEREVDEPDFASRLAALHGMDAPSAEHLVRFLLRQREQSGAPLPGPRRVLVEYTRDPAASGEAAQVIVHTFWGGRVNRALAVALGCAWERAHGAPLDCYASNDHLMLTLPDAIALDDLPTDLFGLVTSRNLDELLRAGLETTSLFGARFRENAGRALLLPRGDAKKRYPLWLNRLRAKKLLASVLRFEDFPILLETWRDLLENEFDLPTLRMLLDDLAAKRIVVHVTRPSRSTPFSDGIVWRQTNHHMYLDDAPAGGVRSNLADELVRDLFHDASAMPALPETLLATFASKLLRTHPDYRPTTPEDILLAVREQVLVPASVVDDWLRQLDAPAQAVERDDAFAGLVSYTLPGASVRLVSDVADLPRVLCLRGGLRDVGPAVPADLRPLRGEAQEPILAYLRAHTYDSDAESAATLIAEFLQNRGPVAARELTATLGLSEAELTPLLDELLETQSIVAGELLHGSAERLLCDADNAERLLRMHRAARRASTARGFDPRPLQELPRFLCEWQGVGQSSGSLEALQGALDRLFGYPLPASLWEEAVLPARLGPYYPSWLDTLVQSYGLGWLGCGKQRITFAFQGDRDLFLDRADARDERHRRDGNRDEGRTDDRREDDGREDDGQHDGLADEGGAPALAQDTDPAATVRRAALAVLANTPRGLGFFDLATATGAPSATLATVLWELAWQGRVSSDSFEVVRRGALSDFTAAPASGTTGRGGLRRWERSRPGAGTWTLLPVTSSRSPIETAELDKDRARIVLARYGVVFRELLEHELPALRWPRLFRALRLLELSGEIVSGHFFTGVPGLQFASHEALRALEAARPDGRVYMINACDPASLCGTGLPLASLPRRIAGHFMVYVGSQLVLVLQKAGRALTVLVEPGHPALAAALGIYRLMLGREFAPQSGLTVETVNDQPATTSPFADDLRAFGFGNDYRGLSLWKR
jgi:ATP-dependent Lhr-like helicase